MNEPVLLDTGPLVAFVSRRDAHHQRCIAELRNLKRAPLTSWSVLTEAVWLLLASPPAIQTVLSMVRRKEIRVAAIGDESADYLADFLSKYQSIRPDLADATLMYLADLEKASTILTLDRRDFSIYRTRDGRALRIRPEAN